MFCQQKLYGKVNKGWWMIGGGILQLFCIGFLSASVSTVEYKMNNVTHYGQFMMCPALGPPGCENMPDFVMLEVSKVLSAIQYAAAVFLIVYLIDFGVLILSKQATYFFSAEVHQHVYNFVVLISFIQMSGGVFGPILCTWYFHDQLEPLDWGHSMATHWIQLPFSVLSFTVVFLTNIYTRREDFAGVDEVQKMV